MPYYVGNDKLSDEYFDGSIEVDEKTHREALDAMLEGKFLRVIKNKLKILDLNPDTKKESDESERKPDEEKEFLIQSVKAEARRRINSIMSDAEQRNSLADQQMAILTFGSDVSNWPEEIRQETVIDLRKWEEIRRLRSISNDIEKMDPIPEDYNDDKYWK